MDILKAHEGTKFPLSRILRERATTVIAATDYDQVIPYAVLSEALGVDVVHDKRGRDAVLAAGRDVLKAHRKKIVNVRREGYRVVRSNEQAFVSRAEQKRARRWLRRALDTVTHVALDGLTPEDVAKVLTEQASVALQLSVQKKLQNAKSLPARDQVQMPTGRQLVDFITRKKASGE